MIELVIVDVFDEMPLSLEDAFPFRRLPPVSKGLEEINIRCHLSNSSVLFA
jgi:hypothetical protein